MLGGGVAPRCIQSSPAVKMARGHGEMIQGVRIRSREVSGPGYFVDPVVGMAGRPAELGGLTQQQISLGFHEENSTDATQRLELVGQVLGQR